MFNRNEISDAPAARQHYPWGDMEEYKPDGGMWSIPKAGDVKRHVAESARLMADPDAFILSMRRVLNEWPRSANVALSTPGLNRRAWMGHAACWLAVASPEETTRLGWHILTDDQQRAANAAADSVIFEARAACVFEQEALF